jgi:HD-like signal output (HDOD) protein
VTPRKRILFVDDEPRVRDGLQRILRPFASSWDMVFAADGKQALAQLDGATFDVLVTDLGMPGMSGPELLRAAQEHHPKVVRVVLAPAAEQALVMTCASLTHQFLTRPCSPELLKHAIDRACDVEATVRREHVGRLVARMDKLPSLPDLYTKLVEKMEDPECSIDDVGDLVARDISMTARILKLVNSAQFGLRRQVSSPHEAVNYVGLDTVKALVLSINAFSQFERISLGALSLDALWNHSLLTAGYAKIIAEIEDGNARLVDEAFVAGMLHDTGKLALAANFCAEYNAAVASCDENATALLAAEESAFGATHAEVGGYLLGLWGLPGPIVDAVTWHHDPLGSGEPAFGALACVHAANVWVHETESSPGRAVLDRSYYEKFSAADRLAEWHRACLEAHSGVGA